VIDNPAIIQIWGSDMISIKVFITALAVLALTYFVIMAHRDYFLHVYTPLYIAIIPALLVYGSVIAMAVSLVAWAWSL
jgi:hypothetical protein